MVTPTDLLRHGIALRRPRPDDGAAVWALVRDCPPLDANSIYCNLLQCDHFADTCIVAERAGAVVGWVSGYIPPTAPDTLFVWQVAVSEAARGAGLGRRMLSGLLDRRACAGVTRLQTTITHDNAASWALFSGFATRTGGTLSSAPHFERRAHFADRHATEHMVTIDLGARLRKAA